MPELEYEFAARCGEDVEIILESIPGSGSIWRVKPVDDSSISFREERQSLPVMGGQTDQHFIFRFGRPGLYRLDFELKRPWEQQVQRHATASVTVR